MAEIAKRLDRTRFVRIHRSLIVNTEPIRSVQSASHSEYLVTLRQHSAALRKDLPGNDAAADLAPLQGVPGTGLGDNWFV